MHLRGNPVLVKFRSYHGRAPYLLEDQKEKYKNNADGNN